jgi:hypothetical protein
MIHEIVHVGRNLGDLMSPASRWMDLGSVINRHDLHSFEATNLVGRSVLFGSCGWLGDEADTVLDIAARNRQAVGWGIGLNRIGAGDGDTPPQWLKTFALASMRDAGVGYPWAPCPSCMSPLFDAPRPPRHEAVAYVHYERPFSAGELPERTNESAPERCADDFRATVDFLASGKVVLTNSYHGAYWATLLGRPVVIVDPWSSKFYRMKHAPTMATAKAWKRAARVARAYPHALDECRTATMQFGKIARALCMEGKRACAS